MPPPKPTEVSASDLEDNFGTTLAHYNQHAESFREGTRDHDVSQNIDALLRHIEGEAAVHHPRFRLRAGARPEGVRRARPRRDRTGGRRPLCRDGARRHRLRSVEQDFLALDLPGGTFDGIFANAALFHVPCAELPRVLGELHATLKPGGVLFSSNPRGKMRKAGTAGATAPTTTSNRGAPDDGRRLHRARALLPARRVAARAAALAGERLASM